ncbi:MAG: hypothetical protein Kow0032_02480 [Methyloligellaceae bacterium]
MRHDAHPYRYDRTERPALHGRTTPAISPRHVILRLARKLGDAFALWSNRRAVHKLARLEDRFLADIGISRADVERALSRPWHVDPSRELQKSVSQRRAATRWARRFSAD